MSGGFKLGRKSSSFAVPGRMLDSCGGLLAATRSVYNLEQLSRPVVRARRLHCPKFVKRKRHRLGSARLGRRDWGSSAALPRLG